jgi:catechol 2,3-dioxygenase-like lactoylglutathione lyase family enzyme
MLSRFDHVTIVVQDLDTACAHYTVLLGRGPSWRGAHPEHGTQSVLFGLGNALLELTAPLGDDEAAAGLLHWLAERGDGVQSIAFGTDDVRACSAQLRERGVRATPPHVGVAHAEDGTPREYKLIELSPRTTRGLSIGVVERSHSATLTAAGPVDAGQVEALDHVVIRSADVAAAQALYAGQLGIRLALDRVVGGVRMLFFRIGGVTLEVVEAGSGEADTKEDAFYGLAYRVRDLAAAHARLVAAGLSASDIRTGKKPGTEVFTVHGGVCRVPTLVLRDPSR